MSENTKAQGRTAKVAKKWPSDHVNHWKAKLFNQKWTDGGKTHAIADLCVRFQIRGERQTINLGTANREEAAQRARDLYLKAKREGWEAIKPKKAEPVREEATVGDVLAVLETRATHLSPNSIKQYATALRLLAGDIVGADIGKLGQQAWRTTVGGVPVSRLTSQAVREWRTARIREAAGAVAQAKRVTHVNSVLRNARGCFGPLMQPHFEDAGFGSVKCPFADVKLERPKRSRLYRSEIDHQHLIDAIFALEPGEVRMVLLVGLATGLRRSEMDRLRWGHVDFDNATLTVETTEEGSVKSYHSQRTINLDAWLVEELRKHQAMSRKSIHVIKGTKCAANAYRAETAFRAAVKWLRGWGVDGTHPLHTLRKEYGSQLAKRHGIQAAAKGLGHADFANVTALYVDTKEKFTSGIAPRVL